MGRIHFTQKAVQDLTEIWNYTVDTWSERQADKYYDLLTDFCNRLGDNPSLGKPYFEIEKDLLGYKAGQHIILYQIKTDKEILIVRILHARMDLRSRIGD